MIKRGIFKANDIRGITEGSDPEWDAAGCVCHRCRRGRGAGSQQGPRSARGGPRHADQRPDRWWLPSSMAC